MSKIIRILFRGILLIVSAFSGCFCMVLMVQGIAVDPVQKIGDEVRFPYRIPGTDIVVLTMVVTDSDVCVDNPHANMFNLASILIKNEGQQWVSQCEISLCTQDNTWCFEATMLPPDSETLVLETNRQSYPQMPILTCKGTAEIFEPAPTEVLFENVDMQSFIVWNTGNAEIKELKIYYKTYYKEWNLYGEGVAFTHTVCNLEPGEKSLVFPRRYAGEYSKILFAEVS